MDFSEFVGLPWQDRGRGPAYDCWGLVATAFERGTGIALPSYSDAYSSAADRADTARIFAGEVGDWREVRRNAEQSFDVAAMKIGGGYHVGLVVRRGLLLHIPRGKASVIEPLARFDAVLAGLYRHRSLGR